MAWPTTDEPRENFATVRFTDDEAADIDWLKNRLGVRSRSAAIRNAVDRVVAAEKRAEKRARNGG